MEKVSDKTTYMCDEVLSEFGGTHGMTGKPTQVSPLALAYIGDAIYEVYIRTYLMNSTDLRTRDLHVQTIRFVRAKSQAIAYSVIAPILSDDETAIYKRGRNTHNVSVPKNASAADYHAATGLEAVVGYLYLTKNDKRLSFIMHEIIKAIEANG